VKISDPEPMPDDAIMVRELRTSGGVILTANGTNDAVVLTFAGTRADGEHGEVTVAIPPEAAQLIADRLAGAADAMREPRP
jgi:hypothetical protein